MYHTVLKAKLHHACVTHVELDYEGSCAIDGYLLDKSHIREYEQISIYNLTNGERFTTYAIRAEDHSRIISINGAAAHKAQLGNRIIICSYGLLSTVELDYHLPTILHLTDQNKIIEIRNHIPIQML